MLFFSLLTGGPRDSSAAAEREWMRFGSEKEERADASFPSLTLFRALPLSAAFDPLTVRGMCQQSRATILTAAFCSAPCDRRFSFPRERSIVKRSQK